MEEDPNKQSFNAQSAGYASARPQYPEALFQYLASCCSQTKVAWDCATGSGQSAIALTRYFERVKATDISTAQIQHAFQHDCIDYSVQAAEQTCFADHEFDLLTVAQALHWFDLGRFWPEVFRVLKPDGLFAAWGYGWPTVSPEIDTRLAQLVFQPIETYWSPQNKVLWDGYEAIDFPLSLFEVPQFAIATPWTLDQFFDYLETWSAVKLYRHQNNDELMGIAKREMSQLWPQEQRKRITMELCLKVGSPVPEP
ncbi:MAG: class I SAM-dependent methyltransferase [Thermosynechococcaceae cyanobacterium]